MIVSHYTKDGTPLSTDIEADAGQTAIVVDPGATMGWCVAKIVNPTSPTNLIAEIIAYGTIVISTTSDYVGDHCLDIIQRIYELIDKYNITHIAVEDYYFSRKTPTGSGLNVAYRTAIYIAARQRNLPYTILSITAWKTYVAGTSRPPRQAIARWGTLAKKLYIQEALWKRYRIRFANHSGISPKTSRPLAPRHDVSDVVGMAIYYLAIIMHIPDSKISCTVTPDPDVVWKKRPKGTFDYSS